MISSPWSGAGNLVLIMMAALPRGRICRLCAVGPPISELELSLAALVGQTAETNR